MAKGEWVKGEERRAKGEWERGEGRKEKGAGLPG